MKVAIVQETVAARRGGAETSTLEMARHLAGVGLDVTVVHRGPRDEPFVRDNVTFLPLVAGGFTRLLRTYRFLQAVNRLCRRERFDIVHAVTPSLVANVYQPRGGTYTETVERGLGLVRSAAWRELKRLGRRLNVRQRFLMRIEQTLLRKRQRRVFVAAVSEYVRQQVIRGYRFPPERARVVYNGVDVAPLSDEEVMQHRTAMRERLGLGRDHPVVLFVAHNFKLKGLRELLQACAARVDEPRQGQANSDRDRPGVRQWALAVAGRDRPDRYQRLARKLGIDQRVHFVGTETPIRHWYAAADVLAHPTWYDPCSRVVLEALSLGLPVVTTRFNGAAEVMEGGRHGVVIDSPAERAGLAAAIAEALGPELREACRAEAGRLRERLSMARHARELAAFYEEVVAARREQARSALLT